MNQQGSIFVRIGYLIMFFVVMYLALIIITPFMELLIPEFQNAAWAPYNLVMVAIVVILIPAMVIYGIMWIFTAPTRARPDDYI